MTLYDDVVLQLEAIGLTIEGNIVSMVEFRCNKVENHIKNFCNRSDIPAGLREVAVDLAVGEYLFFAAAFGWLPPSFDREQILKSVRIGDTDVEFLPALTPATFDGAVAALRDAAKSDLYRYRKMRWAD